MAGDDPTLPECRSCGAQGRNCRTAAVSMAWSSRRAHVAAPRTLGDGTPRGRPSDRPWRARAQPQGRLARPAARRPDRLHRPVRLRQVQPGLRHDLRRGPAPLRRVAVGLRPAVPRPDGQARRRLHRGPVAGGLDRPEVDLPQPALDRRHDHRGLRLPAAALRPHRPAALPGLRPADRAADAAADRRPGARAGGGHPVPGARAGRPRPQGRVRRAVPRAADQGLQPGPGRRRRPPAHRAAEAEEAGEAHDRGGRRPARGQGVGASAGSPTRSRPRSASAAAWSSSTSSTCPRTTRTASGSSPSTSPACTTTCRSRSSSRGRSRSTRPFGACPECTGLGTRMEVDPELVVPDPAKSLADGRDRAVVAAATPRTTSAGCSRRSPTPSGFRMDTPWERLPAKVRKALLHGHDDQVHVRYKNRYGRERSYYTDVRGRASRSSSAGTARPRPTPAASGSRATCARCRARPATARGSSRSSLAVTVGGKSIAEVAAMPIGECAEFLRDLELAPRENGRSPSGCSRRSTSGCGSCSTSASTTSPWTGRPARSPAARRSASGSPPRSAPAWSACSTCSTSRRSACTSATTTG